MSLKEDILNLRDLGLSYNEICKKLGCCKSNICYYVNPDRKSKQLEKQRKDRKKQHPFQRKLERFILKDYKTASKKNTLEWRKKVTNKISDFRKSNRENSPNFTVEDVVAKYSENPKCYLTGESIDIYNPSEYHFDHIVPVSRGGDNTLENLGICTKKVNMAKNDLTPEEFIELCKQVVKFEKSKKK
jgi:CRISPR/Cas system Type II protein with McrA/HNH and RuvC-like nuclease domain